MVPAFMEKANNTTLYILKNLFLAMKKNNLVLTGRSDGAGFIMGDQEGLPVGGGGVKK